MTNEKLDFYAEVRISDGVDDANLRGKVGVIMGISEEDGIVYGYSVRFKELKHSYGFSVDEVSPTGRKFKREDFYDGSSITVSPDGELLPPKSGKQMLQK